MALPHSAPRPLQPNPSNRPHADLRHIVAQAIVDNGGWLGFDAFMQLALYTPGLGYYANDLRKIGLMPGSGSDFVTAPELSELFGPSLAQPIAQALQASGTQEVWEFGAGSGALAEQLLASLGEAVQRYTIVDISGALRERQQSRLAAYAHKVRWANALEPIEGVVVGNEVLDAMPVQLLHRRHGQWHERGVALASAQAQPPVLVWQDRPTTLRPPCEVAGQHDYLTEIHPQAEAFVRTLAHYLRRGAAFFLDYGFTEAEYYHPQRHMGTVVCHRAHQMDDNPLCDVGHKDITAHLNFTGLAVAAQEAGLDVLGYTSQARFLINAGLPERMAKADLGSRAQAHKLIQEHEMGELFKVLGLAKGCDLSGASHGFCFMPGDRTHTL